MSFDVLSYIEEKAGLVNEFLREYMETPLPPGTPPIIREAMTYSLMAGGKRIRPVLALAAYEALGGEAREILPCASALEAIHTYSLIHDDLPAMDDDDLRRGRPTCHKVYGEAFAILAGDALLTEAFSMLLGFEGKAGPGPTLQVARELAAASGLRGMVGGQAMDIISEGAEPREDTLKYIHRHKTGALIAVSVRIGGILAGAGEVEMTALSRYGDALGLAFQVVDDVLDISGDAGMMGKPTGSDEARNKMTYPALYGLDASMTRAGELVREAKDALLPLGEPALPLVAIADYMVQRKS